MAEELVTIADYQFLHEAETARTLLESRGIQAFLADAEMVNTDWFLGNALGYIKVQVSTAHAEAALIALREIKDRIAERESEADTNAEATVCMECGTTLPGGQTDCPACGWSYAPEGPEEPAEADSGSTETSASVMETFRSMKRPFLLLLASPLLLLLLVVALLILALVIGIVRAIVG